MSPEPVPQPCEVCGVETTRRCSACLEAGISLFFCGKDHQKLVWPAHKTVCGAGKAHPFMVEPLTDEEVAWFVKKLDVVTLRSSRSLREQLEDIGGERAEVVLHKLSSGFAGRNEVPNGRMLLHWMRHGTSVLSFNTDTVAVMRERCEAQSIAYFDSAMASKYVGKTALLVSKRLGALPVGASSLPTDGATWYSLLQHKALIVIRLSQITHMSPARHDYRLGEYAAGADNRLMRWIRTGAGTGNPFFVCALSSWAGVVDEARASRAM